MTWRQLRALADAGVGVGSHAWKHRSMGRLAEDEVADEARRSKQAIEAEVGRPVSAFAYPFGTRQDFTPETGAVLRACGYSCAFTSQHGAVAAGTDPFAIPRVKVEGGEGLWMFRRITSGGLDGWRWVDRMLWRLQAGER